MTRTTINLPDELLRTAEAQARRRGLSLDDFIQEALSSALKDGGQDGRDPFFADEAVSEAPGPADTARRHDDYLHEGGA